MLLQRKYESREASSYSLSDGLSPSPPACRRTCGGLVCQLDAEEELGRDQHRLHRELDAALEALAVLRAARSTNWTSCATSPPVTGRR